MDKMFHGMRLVLASRSALKVRVCREWAAEAGFSEVIPISVESGVPEQPMGGETRQGAENRLQAAVEKLPDADFYLAMENGIFEEDGHFLDRALVLLSDRAGGFLRSAVSDPVEFPAWAVEEVERRGRKAVTVGRILAESGVVKSDDDPHLCLCGKGRGHFLREALERL